MNIDDQIKSVDFDIESTHDALHIAVGRRNWDAASIAIEKLKGLELKRHTLSKVDSFYAWCDSHSL